MTTKRLTLENGELMTQPTMVVGERLVAFNDFSSEEDLCDTGYSIFVTADDCEVLADAFARLARKLRREESADEEIDL